MFLLLLVRALSPASFASYFETLTKAIRPFTQDPRQRLGTGAPGHLETVMVD